MYVVAGATGRVGGATAERLSQAGAPLRVLVRDPKAGEAWQQRGAEVTVADLADRDGLTRALRGTDGCFVLLPFDPADQDPEATTSRLILSISGAVADSQVPHVVLLSSGGADLPEGTGPIVALHHLEAVLRDLDTTLTALRPGHFQEKVTDLIDTVESSGVYPVFATSADVPIPLIATRDVGHIAAEALLSPPAATESIDALGPQYTEREVAALLASKMGRDVDVLTIPRDARVDALVGTGMPLPAATALAELYAASEDGLLAPRGDRTVHGTTPLETTLAGLLSPAAS